MPACTDLDDYRWLTSPEAVPWLGFAAETGASTLQLATKLRRELSANRVRLVLEQARLRLRGKEKFAAAERMFFTQVGLEQATDGWLAGYKAARFAAKLGAMANVADLCCGIGGDLAAMAGRLAAVGVDRDPALACLAEANVVACCGPDSLRSRTTVRVADVAEFAIREFAGWHIDPDRRPAGRRTTRVAFHEPSPEVMERLLAECPHGALKLAPAAELPDGWQARAELEWISRRRECRQLVAWFGELAEHPGKRRATVLDPLALQPRSIFGTGDEPLDIAANIGRHVFDPDAAVLAARLNGVLAAEHRLAAISMKSSYLTADHAVDDPALSCFEVLDTMPLRIKTIKSWLEARDIGRLEVKKRGVDIEPESLRKQLRLRGDNEATLLLAMVHGKPIVIAAKRCQTKD